MTVPRKMSFDDVQSFKDMLHVALSPDGRRVAFVMSNLDQQENARHSAIWLLQLDEQGQATGEPHQLTSGTKSDSSPVWAPDSRRLLFLSTREGEQNQLWLIDVAGGEARRLTDMLHGVSEAAWSPDGQWIAFTAPTGPTDDDAVLTGQKKLNSDEKKQREDEERTRLRTISRISYRLDGRGLFDRYNQLFVMPAPPDEERGIDSASIRRLTAGEYGRAFLRWTPDSQEIGLLCNRDENRDFSFVQDLWAIERETGAARRISNNTMEIASYAWSPDGRQVLLAGSRDMRIEGSSNIGLYLLARDGGPEQLLTGDVDNHAEPGISAGFGLPGPYQPQWSADGQRVYFLVSERGCIHPYRLDIARKETTRLLSDDSVTYCLALLPDEQGLLLTRALPLHPWELYQLPLNAGEAAEATRLTHLHDQQLAEFTLSEPERIYYQGSNSDEVDGWLIRPVGAREGTRYPLALFIHGGPQGAYGVSMYPQFQLFAALGFAVFYCNPHGSTGSGQAFMRQVEGDWGGWDFQDIMRGVDECIARGIADPERLVVTGYSYGGYMSMFTIGHTTRFKAAVPMAGVSNLTSFVGTSDLGFWQTYQAKGKPWDPERADYYRERSPLTAAAQVTTPTLFVHPENDLRCPIEQSEQFYMTLKLMGNVPTELVRIPGSWHGGTAKPSQWRAYWEKTVEWFRKYVEIRPAEYD